MDILRAIITETKTSGNPNEIFSELTEKYGNAVYKFCRSLTYSKEDAEDLFQETFLKIFEQPHKIKDAENPRDFLFSTALYIWKNRQRKYARRNRIAPIEPLDESVADNINIEEEYAAREEIGIVRELVESLPEKLRIPVILYYTVEMDVNEIASTLKIPAGTVKSRLFNARKIIEKGLIENEQ